MEKNKEKFGDSIVKQIFVWDRAFYRTMVRLSLPSALQALLSLLVMLADNVMISRYDAAFLAPVSQANSISTFVIAALNGLGSGAVVLVSQYWGKKDHTAIKRVFSVAVAMGLTVAVLCILMIQLIPETVVSLVLDPELKSLTPVAVSYLRIACLSFLPFGLTSALVGGLKGVEVVKVTLFAAVISLLSNVVLNALLIFGFGPIPSLGVEGAAIATVLARVIEFVVVWVYCFHRQKALSIQPKDLLHHEKWAWKDYLRFGGPVGFTDAQWALVGLMKMSIIGHLGAAMMSAVNITDTMMNLGTMFTFALAGGACVMVGKAVGQKDMEKVHAYSRTIQALFAIIGVVMAGIVILLRLPFISLYGQTADAVKLADTLIFIGAITLMGTSYHASCFVGINRGAGDNRFVMLVDLICGWLVVLPLTYLAAFVLPIPEGIRLPIVFLCTRIDQCFKWIIAFIRLRGEKWIKQVTR
ncbi:MAG: MATE family efflux transporter [Clostridia bacterium]|nr:MATE family efflux transporter [Clostridia bacterium]